MSNNFRKYGGMNSNAIVNKLKTDKIYANNIKANNLVFNGNTFTNATTEDTFTIKNDIVFNNSELYDHNLVQRMGRIIGDNNGLFIQGANPLDPNNSNEFIRFGRYDNSGNNPVMIWDVKNNKVGINIGNGPFNPSDFTLDVNGNAIFSSTKALQQIIINSDLAGGNGESELVLSKNLLQQQFKLRFSTDTIQRFSIYSQESTTVTPKERFTITRDTGNVGINMTNPQTKLHIRGSSYNEELFRIENGTDGNEATLSIGTNQTGSEIGDNAYLIMKDGYGTERLNINLIGDTYLNNTGNVGIGTGTTAPTSKLHVVGDIQSSNNFIMRDITNIVRQSEENFDTYYNGFERKIAVEQDRNYAESELPYGYDVREVASISFKYDLERQQYGQEQTYSPKYGMGIAFNTFGWYENSTLQTRMYIRGDGNIGIGTDTPTETLDVSGNINLTGQLFLNGQPYPDAGSNWDISGSNIYRLNGNVGIGTDSPQKTLDVSGDVLSNVYFLRRSDGATNVGSIRFNGFDDIEYYNSSGGGGYTLFTNNGVNVASRFRINGDGKTVVGDQQDTRGLFTINGDNDIKYSINTDPTDSGRILSVNNATSDLSENIFSAIGFNISQDVSHSGNNGVGAGRALGDIRFVRNDTLGLDTQFVFSSYGEVASSYKDLMTLRHDASGNTRAGVGETNPQATLHVETGETDAPTTIIENTHTGNIGITTLALRGHGLVNTTLSLEPTDPTYGSMALKAQNSHNRFVYREQNLQFDRDDDGTNTMTLATNGDVGINMTNPQTKLHIRGSSYNEELFRIENGTDDNEATLSIGTNQTGSEIGDNAYLIMKDGYGTERLNINLIGDTYLNNTGNVGIGTGTPQFKLDVSGNTRLLGDVKIGLSNKLMSSGTDRVYLELGGNNPFYDAVFGIDGNPNILYIEAGGNVGVGTNDPSFQFHLVNSNYAKMCLQSLTGDDRIHQELIFKTHFNSRGGGIFWQDASDPSRNSFFGRPYNGGSPTPGVIYNSTTTAEEIIGATATTLDGPYREPMFSILDNTGNVGIGTGTPQERLDVSGNIQANKLLNKSPIHTINYTDPSFVNGLELRTFETTTQNEYTLHVHSNRPVYENITSDVSFTIDFNLFDYTNSSLGRSTSFPPTADILLYLSEYSSDSGNNGRIRGQTNAHFAYTVNLGNVANISDPTRDISYSPISIQTVEDTTLFTNIYIQTSSMYDSGLGHWVSRNVLYYTRTVLAGQYGDIQMQFPLRHNPFSNGNTNPNISLKTDTTTIAFSA